MTGKGIVASASITIQAPAARVWEALTEPEQISQYLFGTQVDTDWQVGSPITYTGVWEGKAYKDKGVILEVVPHKKLVSTFWSALSGLPDVPENYNTVQYKLDVVDGGTKLSILQDNNATQGDADHAAQNWHMVLQGLKSVVEA